MPVEHINLRGTQISILFGAFTVIIDLDPVHSIESTLDICYRETVAFSVYVIDSRNNPAYKFRAVSIINPQ
jgi:hypothetical protein